MNDNDTSMVNPHHPPSKKVLRVRIFFFAIRPRFGGVFMDGRPELTVPSTFLAFFVDWMEAGVACPLSSRYPLPNRRSRWLA